VIKRRPSADNSNAARSVQSDAIASTGPPMAIGSFVKIARTGQRAFGAVEGALAAEYALGGSFDPSATAPLTAQGNWDEQEGRRLSVRA